MGNAKASPGRVLILEPTVFGGAASLEAQAAGDLGFGVDVVTGAEWGSLTADEFAGYAAIVLGDTCSIHTGPIAAAEANAQLWGPLLNGNVIVLGTDPRAHYRASGAEKLMRQGIAFAAGEQGKTGGYLDLSCYYHFSPTNTPVPLLDGLNGGGFEVVGGSKIALDDAHVVASHPALDGLTDADLSNWRSSVHEAFTAFPEVDFEVLAIAHDPSGWYTASDGSVGYPYILARGEELEVISDIGLSPDSATNTVGASHSLSATVETNGEPVAGVDVTFSVVGGPHIGTTGTGVSDALGAATWPYAGVRTGIDTVEASFVDSRGRPQRSDRVTAEWLPVPDGTIVVHKLVINDDGGSSEPGDFMLLVDGEAVTPGEETPVSPGVHVVSEVDPGSGYRQTSIVCDGVEGGQVNVSPGETVTCEITNDDVDLTPPLLACIESTNPSGKNTPKAGNRSNGQNEDGFYQIEATDEHSPSVTIMVNGFGPFEDGDTIKYTQASDGQSKLKTMGSGKGNASAVAAHIIGGGDMVVTATDTAGNTAEVTCLVPRPPK